MKTRQLIFLLTTLAIIATLVACSGISSKTPASPAASIAALTGSGQSAFVGAAFSGRLLATVTAGGSPMSGVVVTFTAPTSGASGTFAGGVNTAMTDDRGVAASPVFTANATIGNYAVTAAVSGASTPASFNLANTAAPVSVMFNPAPPTSMLIGSTTTLTAVVANDSTNAGVTWSCAPVSACGSLNPTTSTGNTATTTYTAPAAIPTGGSVTVTATSIKDSTQSATATIAISAPPPISVSLQPTPASMATGTTATLTAVVTNDPTNSGVTWTCLPANACGSFNPTTSTGSTATTTYTAPTAIPSGGSVFVTAASVQNPLASASATIIITMAGAISVTLNPAPPPILKPGATTTLTALVVGDATNSGVTWSCTHLNACGSFNPTTSTGSTATTTYTAPTAIPSGGSVTVTATAVKSASSSASANIAITPYALPDGTYVFSLTQASTTATFPGSGYFVAGAFQVASGAITGGEQDFSSTNGILGSDLINSAGSGIATTADGNLQITLTTCNGTVCSTTDPNVGVAGVETLNGTLVSASRALINEFDASTTGSGSLDRQVANIPAPAQGYAFFMSGFDPNFFFVGIGGVINVDGTASGGTIPISGAGSVFDINDLTAFPPLQNQSFAASSVTTPDPFGRVTFALNPSAASTIAPINLVGYIVDSSRIYLVETNDTFRQPGGSMGGVALGQGSNTGKFNTASLFGSSFVFGATGSDSTGFLQEAGVLTANPGSTVSGTLSTNDLTVTGTQSFTGGALTVDPTGRVTLTNLTTNAITLQLYLTGSGTGTVVSMDNNTDVVSGLAFQQTAGASFSGTYGMNATGFDLANRLEFDDVGPISANPGTGTGSLVATHTIDENFMTTTPLATPTPGLSVSGAFSPVASGIFTGTITGLDIDSNANVDNFTYYIVDKTRVLAIETDTNQLTLIYFELQQ
jgi:hypothetical protein